MSESHLNRPNRLFIDAASIQVAVVLPSLAIKDYNGAFHQMFRNVRVGENFFAICRGLISDQEEHPLARARKTEHEACGQVEFVVNGEIVRLETIGFPLFEQDSRLSSLLCLSVEVPPAHAENPVKKNGASALTSASQSLTAEILQLSQLNAELQRKNEELRLLALNDSLTGLLNRRAFSINYERELRRSERYRHSISLLFIDIDHFRDFNNTYDYDTGDAVLKNVAKIIFEVVRDTDIVTRYGGEEFVVILPETGLNYVHKVAERLRVRVENGKVATRHGEMAVTVSIGTATTYSPKIDDEKFLNTAVGALHEAKQSGRNRTVSREMTEHVG
ncbi:hypothetical protein FACS1894139_13330 [Planctomycetales bacterium]|nr:hypothetical protein FACS1894107_09640 [Planctomycetales bacterium]GHT06751.1 hypothetical protein FACS1894139_13330 [Planctomycetales bacterium]